MFRALTCPSSGGQIVLSQHLVSSLSVNGCTVCRMRAVMARRQHAFGRSRDQPSRSRLLCALLQFWSKYQVGKQNSLYSVCFKCIPRNANFKRQYRPCSTSSFYCIIRRSSSPSFASVLSPLQFTFTSVRREAHLRTVKSSKF